MTSKRIVMAWGPIEEDTLSWLITHTTIRTSGPLASTGGAWATLDASEKLWQGSLFSPTDDGYNSYWSGWGWAVEPSGPPSDASLGFRLYDVTTGAVITIPSDLSFAYYAKIGPINLPAGDARFRLEYSLVIGGGAPSLPDVYFLGAALEVRR